jgi:hypothetical protein
MNFLADALLELEKEQKAMTLERQGMAEIPAVVLTCFTTSG